MLLHVMTSHVPAVISLPALDATEENYASPKMIETIPIKYRPVTNCYSDHLWPSAFTTSPPSRFYYKTLSSIIYTYIPLVYFTEHTNPERSI